jgi:hypothetical protein
MPDCGICAEFSKRLDEALDNCTALLAQLREALKARDQEQMDAPNLERSTPLPAGAQHSEIGLTIESAMAFDLLATHC